MEFWKLAKGRSTILLNREEYFEKCIDHLNNCPSQLFKKDPTTKIKAKTLTELKDLKANEFIDNKLYSYIILTDSPAPRFCGQPKIHYPRSGDMSLLFHIVALHYNLKSSTAFSNYIRNITIIDTIIKDYVNNDNKFTRKTAILI